MSAQLQPATEASIALGVPAEEYHRRELGVATSGVLRMLRDRTPAHYRAWVDAKDDGDTPALMFGRAYHCRVLEPEVFAASYVRPPENAPARPSSRQRNAKKPSPETVAAIAFWDAWEAENAGKTILPAEDFERIEAMHAALLAHPVAAGIMREGVSEVTFRWVDDATGVHCKARADWWVEARGFLMDLKTTDDASPAAFARSVDRYGYHIQHAHYCDAARMCGKPVKHYLILAQEKEPPYLPAVYHIDAAAEARGFELRDRALQTIRQCLDTDTWPGYAGITELSLPPWALKD